MSFVWCILFLQIFIYLFSFKFCFKRYHDHDQSKKKSILPIQPKLFAFICILQGLSVHLFPMSFVWCISFLQKFIYLFSFKFCFKHYHHHHHHHHHHHNHFIILSSSSSSSSIDLLICLEFLDALNVFLTLLIPKKVSSYKYKRDGEFRTLQPPILYTPTWVIIGKNALEDWFFVPLWLAWGTGSGGWSLWVASLQLCVASGSLCLILR